jgi:DNA-binding SARP family transcriptional activator
VFGARVVRPLPCRPPLTQPALLSILDFPLTVVAAQAAFIVDANVALVLHERGRLDRTAWVRLDHGDARPDHLIRSLEDSVGSLDDSLAEARGEQIRLPPGLASQIWRMSPEFCWAVGRRLASQAPAESTLVVESPDAVPDAWVLINILLGWAGSSGDRRAVLLWHGRVPRRVRRVASVVLDADQLSIDAALLHQFVAVREDVLPPRATARLLRLARGRAAFVHDVVDAAEREQGSAAIEEMLGTRICRQAFMKRLARHLVSCCSPDEREALSLAIRLGYWHPTMDRVRLSGDEPNWPWFGPLEGGWWRLRLQWRRTLSGYVEAGARSRRRPAGPALERLSPRYRRPTSTEIEGIGEAAVAVEALRPIAVSPDEDALVVPEVPIEERSTASANEVERRHTLKVRLLGRFEVAIDDQTVGSWDSPRGLALFKYLLTHRASPSARDVLMDVFWPAVSPDQARNRFHVALSALRRSLRAIGDVPVVVFSEGAYGINPDLDLQVDVDEFEQWVESADRAQREDDSGVATACYEQAVALYRGDLLAESPYEDWALLPREALRVSYLDVLDRLLALHSAHGSLGPCIAVAQLILQQDACREDAHRMLMRCYTQQGRVHEALRQFELCSRALALTLDSSPSNATVELYRSIRSGRPT